MSGDSPNAFTNENVFDFKEGRSSPAPTTSKEQNPGVVTASVLVEPPKAKDKDAKEEEDRPDFCSPTLNQADKDRIKPNEERSLDFDEPKMHDDPDKGEKKEEQGLLNGGLDRLPNPYGRSKDYEEDSEDDTCIVNCIYYTMECCKCSIM